MYEQWTTPRGTQRSQRYASPSKPNVGKIIGHSVQGSAIRAFFWGHGRRYVYILGAIHGDESKSSQLVERVRELLAQDFREQHEAVTFIMIPCLNPDGVYRLRRTNVNNVDLNRNFPIRDHGDGTKLNYSTRSPLEPLQPETLALLQLCRKYPPALIYSIHQPFNVINYDGPAAKIALDMQRLNGMCIRPVLSYATTGSLGEYFGILKRIPVITLELPGKGRGGAWEDVLQRNAEAIISSALKWQARQNQ